MREFTEQELVRREKLEKIRELGIDPFGHKYPVTDFSMDIKNKYAGMSHDDLEKENVVVQVAGRIMFIRKMGKASFFSIKDKLGNIQVYISINDVGEDTYSLFKTADLGDIVGVKGRLMLTGTGEITIKCMEYTHLVKALRPLPEKYHGLSDVEERFRRRYVDLIVNDDARRVAFARPKIIRSIQRYMDQLGYVEVETPILGTILGGAAAKPFITHHNAQNIDMYLRIATELNLKRLLVGGMDAVYEIGRIFRNEGMDKKHNPEFTTIELYKAYSDLEGMMDVAEGIFSTCAMELNGTYELDFLGHHISLAPGFRRVHMVDLIKEKTGVDFFQVKTLEEAKKLATEHGVEIENHFEFGHIVNAFFEKFVEDTIIEPTFVYGHPIEISPLAKKDPNDPRFTQRFELFIIGSEYANAFTELNDPIDQYERFESQLKERELGNEEANDMDIDFVEALEYGMPPAGGMGMGIDRMVMLLTGSETIREVILFPTMKPLKDSFNAKKTKEVKVENLNSSDIKIEPLFLDYIDFETFSKADYRAVKIIDCEAVEKSEKLLKFTLNDGTSRPRTILSGIHEYYEPEELIGKTAIAIVNLPTKKIMGINSEGMLISAVHEENGREGLHLLIVDDSIPAGAKLY